MVVDCREHVLVDTLLQRNCAAGTHSEEAILVARVPDPDSSVVTWSTVRIRKATRLRCYRAAAMVGAISLVSASPHSLTAPGAKGILGFTPAPPGFRA